MELMWSLANTLQLLFFIGLIELNYPSDLESTYKIMSYSNFDNPLTKYMTSVVFIGVNFINSPISTKFGSFGFESTNILVNSLDKLMMVGGLIVMIVLLKIMVKYMKDSDSK